MFFSGSEWTKVSDDDQLESLVFPHKSPVLYLSYQNFPQLIRVQSYNLSSSSRAYESLPMIVSVIKSANPDILMLQGVGVLRVKGFFSVKEYDMFEALCQELHEYPHKLFKNRFCIFARYPVSFSQEFDFAVSATVAMPKGSIDLYNTQLDDHPNVQPKQCVELLSCMQDSDRPQIIAGDFKVKKNYTTSADILEGRFPVEGVKGTVKLVGDSGANTFPSWDPVESFDRIYYRNVQMTGNFDVTGYAESSNVIASDHCAVLSDFLLDN